MTRKCSKIYNARATVLLIKPFVQRRCFCRYPSWRRVVKMLKICPVWRWVWKPAQARHAMHAINSKKKYAKVAIVAHGPKKTHNLAISHCCVAEEGYMCEMFVDSNARAQLLFWTGWYEGWSIEPLRQMLFSSIRVVIISCSTTLSSPNSCSVGAILKIVLVADWIRQFLLCSDYFDGFHACFNWNIRHYTAHITT